jgi:hypothetical protein
VPAELRRSRGSLIFCLNRVRPSSRGLVLPSLLTVLGLVALEATVIAAARIFVCIRAGLH